MALARCPISARRVLLAVVVGAIVFAVPRPADAGIVTVGNPLDKGSAFSIASFAGSTFVNGTRTGPGALAASPVDGVILRWRTRGNYIGGPFRLRVVRPVGSGFVGAGTSAPVTPLGEALQAFPTQLPIRAGDLIGIDTSAKTDFVATTDPVAGTDMTIISPPLVDGGPTQTGTTSHNFYELMINADVQPAPKITQLGPLDGSVKGGTEVNVIGTDFTRVSGVSFGSLPASRYTVHSENQIVATAPPAIGKENAPITITTIAGSATFPQPFSYRGCLVPKLKGVKLKGAKKRLRDAECLPGKVRRAQGVGANTGRVIKQKPRPGTLLAPGARVFMKLG